MRLIGRRLNYAKPWKRPDVYIFTGNPVRKIDGAIVMGRGAAKQVRDNWPTVQYRLDIDEATHLTFLDIAPGQTIGWFKVKNHWKDAADLSLIRKSTMLLFEEAINNPTLFYHMNAPGIGNGRLDWTLVATIVETLPDNVLIYRG